jgi:hypothetical protein
MTLQKSVVMGDPKVHISPSPLRPGSAELTKILASCTKHGADAAHLRPQ